jgi:hypothetical protein
MNVSAAVHCAPPVPVRILQNAARQRHIYRLFALAHLLPISKKVFGLFDALGAPHVGDRSEAELIQAFVDRIAELNPQLVTFNGVT